MIDGYVSERWMVDPISNKYSYTEEAAPVLMKVETHNHPTAIAPYPGAATGSGGEIRDEGAVGRGSKPKAGLSGFTTSHLNIPGFAQPWEIDTGKPDRIVSALDIMLEGPVGAAAFNNEYGRPALSGYHRTFEMAGLDRDAPGLVRGYHKPVMIAGGVGHVRPDHVHALPFDPGTALVVLGGPAMLIGLGGGAASSMTSGSSSSDLDFASVQRENAEMERRCQEVIDRCAALGADNPILLIHDVGAGGLSNALPELIKDAGAGGRFELREVPNADPGMTPLEIWCNEAQERYVLGIARASLETFEKICKREHCPYAVVGESTVEQRLLVSDRQFDTPAVDLPMDLLFGNTPTMERSFSRRLLHLDTIVLIKPLASMIERVLLFPAVASKQYLITIGDRSITGMVVQEQMVGPWQVPVSDVAVTAAGYRTSHGEAFAMGERSPLALINPPASARMAVAEALTNLFSADVSELKRVVLSANWMAAAGSDLEEQALFDAVHAVGMELCPELSIAIPVGKDSLSMSTRWRQDDSDIEVRSPMTLIVSAFAPVDDVRKTMTPQLKAPLQDSVLVLVSLNAQLRLGGSAVYQAYKHLGDVCPDVDDASRLAALLNGLQELNRQSLILAYHDRSDGGVLVTLLEMAFAGRCGFEIEIEGNHTVAELFAEEVGVVIQVAKRNIDAVMAQLNGLHVQVLGSPTIDQTIRIHAAGELVFESDRASLQATWSQTSYRMQKLRDNPACADEEFELIRATNPGLNTSLTFESEGPDRSIAVSVHTARPRVAVLREQGVNGQVEMAAAFDRAGFEAIDVHMSDLLNREVDLNEFPVLVACGGFSYGDVLGGGGGWAKRIRYHQLLSDAFSAYFESDRLVLGICNGCQMMANLKTMIPGADHWPRFVRNRSEQFEGRTVMVRINASSSPWLNQMQGSVLSVPVAHGEGRAEFDGDDEALMLAGTDVCLQYVNPDHAVSNLYPYNPNGAVDGLAGVTAADGRVLVMMPHPERVYRNVLNGWRVRSDGEDGPWMRLFRNAYDGLK